MKTSVLEFVYFFENKSTIFAFTLADVISKKFFITVFYN